MVEADFFKLMWECVPTHTTATSTHTGSLCLRHPSQTLRMLPLTQPPPGGSASQQPLYEYLWSRLRRGHMDFEYALWLMVNLCTSPRTAFRSTLYHSRTKHQWARDDPAFLVLLLYLVAIVAIAWSFAFEQRSFISIFGRLLYIASVDFFLFGVVLSTIGWWVANNYLHERSAQRFAHAWSGASPSGGAALDDAVEWLYAFDVHSNAFLPMFVLLHIVQYLLLPLLLRDGFLATLLSNCLYAAAFSSYHYLTFLGYSELPFLQRCECFVYPIAGILVLLILSLPFGFNATHAVVYMYFG